MEKIQSADESVINFITLNTYPMTIRDFNGVHLIVNQAWDRVMGDMIEGKKLYDIITDDAIIKSNIVTCGIFDTLIQDSSLILNETFGYKSYMVHRSPIVYKNKRCVLIQVIAL